MKLSSQQKGRVFTSLKKVGIILAAGLAYYFFVRISGWGIPCPIRLITGAYCPGCGISRMCMALLRLDFSAAFRANALLMLLLPPAAVLGIRRWLLYIKTGATEMDLPEKIGFLVAFVLAVTFWILRNQERFAFLAPQG